MDIFYEEHRHILQTLLDHSVDFMLIGGYAVNYYGYNRSTGDMDIWIRPENETKKRLLEALSSMDFEQEGIDTIRGWDFTHPQKFRVGADNRPDRTEFTTHISGVQYEEAVQHRVIADLDGLSLPIIQYQNLIQNKKATGRLKDLTDVEYLEKIMLLKSKK